MLETKPTEITHLMCQFWPSQKSIPGDTESFTKLVAMMESLKQANDDKLIVVNCL